MSSIHSVILRGQLTINLVVITLIVGPPVVGWYWFTISSFWLKILLSLVLGITGVCIAWWYWSKVTPRWKLRAFSEVPEKEWLDLYRAAVRTKLIWPVGHPYEKTEIRTLGTNEMLTYIYERLIELRRIEEINDDFTTPATVQFGVSRRGVWLLLIPIVFLFFGSLVILLTEGFRIWQAWFGLALMLFLLFRNWRYFTAFIIGFPALIFSEFELEYQLFKPFKIYWEDIVSIKIINDGEKLEVTYFRRDKIAKATVDLGSIEFESRDRLMRYLSTFIKRSNTNYE